MAFGGKECRLGRISGHDRVDRMGRAMNKKVCLIQQDFKAHAKVISCNLQTVDHPSNRIIWRCRSLEHVEAVIIILDNQVRERPPGINSKAHGFPSLSDSTTLPDK